MKVLIVAKTRMGSGACIGGITFEGQSVRLIPAIGDIHEGLNLEYQVGEVWEIEGQPAPETIAPHTENFLVYRKKRASPLENFVAFIEQQMPPKVGSIEQLYEGLVQISPNGALYIAERAGIPPYSTLFWQTNQPLIRDDSSKRIRYRYPTSNGSCTLTFVGFQEPVAEIPAQSLLRVSLAHWWCPPDSPEIETRCYVQLSGWFLLEDNTKLHLKKKQGDTNHSKKTSDSITVPATYQTLKNIFGFDEFRPMQADVVQNILQKRDTLAVMPTGSGKSLCYQLPALLFSGLTVVVSPLISLMQDQVEQLRELGITALYLNSTLSYSDYIQATHHIRDGTVKLLYAAPETLLRPETLLLLEQRSIDCLTIDEAHCISEWGHDFRPEYRQLSELRHRLPHAVCLAVTATATHQVRRDIKSSLNISEADEFVASFNRENLNLTVEPRTDGLAQTIAFLEAHRDESGIIYCSTRKQVDTLTTQLKTHGWSVLPYHAGLDNQTRQNYQRQFSQDDVPIMVATIAFGMGINKSNVRFILHYDLPKNIESYYQQIGRAGRDGLPADCLLLYSSSDTQTIYHFIQQQEPARQKIAQFHLQAMLGFAETTVCRRQPLLTYFGESYTAEKCGSCDNCQTAEQTLSNLTIPAQKFLSCIKRTGEIFGVNHIIDVLRGSHSQSVLLRGHDKLSTYNIGGEFSKKEWQYLARQFIQQGFITQDMEHGSLKLTAKGYMVFKGETVQGLLPSRAVSVRPKLGGAYDPALFQLLRKKRKELAEASGVPPFVILSDRSLIEMAMYFPHSRSSLVQIHGVGKFKLEKYGETFLAIIRKYCAERQIVEKPKTVVLSTSAPRRNRTEEVMEWYNSGRAIPEIAEIFGVKQNTVIDHLWKVVQLGQTLRPDSLLELSQLSQEEQKRVLNMFTEMGIERLRPVFEALNETVSYDELHLIRLHIALTSFANSTRDHGVLFG